MHLLFHSLQSPQTLFEQGNERRVGEKKNNRETQSRLQTPFLGHFWKQVHFLFFLPGPVAQAVKNPPAMWETRVRSLGWEDPLEEGMATHFSMLAWRIPVDGGTWQTAVHGVAESRTRRSDQVHSTIPSSVFQWSLPSCPFKGKSCCRKPI